MRRDAVTAGAYLGLAGWAWFLYGFGATVTLIVSEQGISRAVGGLHLTAQAAGGVISGLTVTTVVARAGRRGGLTLAGALVLAGVLLLMPGRPTALTLFAALVLGTGGSLMINVLNPVMIAHHGAAGTAIVSEANAVAAAAGMIAPLAVGLGVRLGLTWRPGIAITALGVAAMVWRYRTLGPVVALDAAPPRARREDAGGARLPRSVWVPIAIVVLCVAVEFSVTTWTAGLLRQRLDFSASAAAASLSAVVLGMAIGRLLLSRLALRRPARGMLHLALAVAAVGWALVWTAPSGALALPALFVLGIGIGWHFPLGLSLVLRAAQGRTDQASGALSVGVAMGIGIAPFVLGAIADATDVHTAFAVIPVFLAIAAILLWRTTSGPAAPSRD